MLKAGWSLLLLTLSVVCSAQTVIEVQEVKELKPTGSLGTCDYSPTQKEKAFFEKLSASERTTGSFVDEHEYQIRGKRGKYVSWFGVVRESRRDPQESNTFRVLLEQKYFDGMTDCHIMLVSQAGAGDFEAMIKLESTAIPALSLVRVYGVVSNEEARIPRLNAEYVRVWPWFTFTFTDLGPADRGNPRWAKYCLLCKHGRIYDPYPTEDYYLRMLGDPKDFGLKDFSSAQTPNK